MEKETVRAYAQEMERRFGLAGISEDESRKIFINGLKTALKPYVLSKCAATWSEAEKLAIEGEHIYSIQEETIRETCKKVINKLCKNYLSRTDDHMNLSATHTLTGKTMQYATPDDAVQQYPQSDETMSHYDGRGDNHRRWAHSQYHK